MSDTVIESVLRRDRLLVAMALGAVTALSWSYLLWLSATMSMGAAGSPGSSMSMPGMQMPGTTTAGMLAPAFMPWSAADFLFMFAMWTVMMVGMMTPAASPMILLYARVGRNAVNAGNPFAASAWFASGYLLAWTGFAAIATIGQWLLTRAALLSPAMAGTSHLFGGIVLIAAGLYQWTPLKDVCLSQCQSPLGFIQRNGGFRGDRLGAVRLGLRHGAYCVGCCWALMALLFVGGVMNLLWIAGIGFLVLAEKVLPAGAMVQRIAGAILVAAGAWLLF